MPRFANKVDGNQAEIVQALRATGWAVRPMNKLRGAWLDLVIAKHGVTIAVECKMPGEMLTESEKEFMEEWPGLKMIAYSGQDAVDKAGAMMGHWNR